jgi:hypothetical protein
MEKEFVPYELALRMKALGFDEPCFGYYVIDGEELIVEKWMRHPNKSTWTINAPTFSQAFRWFRENHDLKGYIEPVEFINDNTETYHWCIYNICNSGNSQLTHEEAELACLTKLIEIVEQQNN